jgi:hypothetical protein
MTSGAPLAQRMVSCIEMGKWPYHTEDWKIWLKSNRTGANPPLPDTPQWQPWLANRENRQSR